MLYNVREEPVFSVMAASWFCEKSGWIGKVEDVKLVLFFFFLKKKKTRISTGNHFEEEDFYPDELWNRRISSSLIHLGLDVIWFQGLDYLPIIGLWMANMRIGEHVNGEW